MSSIETVFVNTYGTRQPAMYMFKRALVLSWAIVTLSLPLEGFSTATPEQVLEIPHITLITRENPFACPANKVHNPTVTEWKWALDAYCERHTPTDIRGDSPLAFNYQLTASDNKPIRWFFKVWIDDNFRKVIGGVGEPIKYTVPLSTNKCKQKFMAMITENKGGGMPKVYCDKAGVQLFRGGSYRELVAKGFAGEVVWETRQFKGGDS
jgi:hypothetical protein